MKAALLLSLLFVTPTLRAQPASPSTIGPVGYRQILLTDSSRRYDPSAHPGNRLYYRPIEIDCWYPAQPIRTTPATSSPVPPPSTPTPTRFGYFLQLFEQRANSFQHDTTYTGLAAEIAQYLCAGLGITDTASFTQLQTHSYINTQRQDKPFPLILYLCSYNGMSYENIPLFESLAANGYIVASITSVGRYPGNMTTDFADLLEQTSDAGFTLRYLRSTGWVDTTTTGLLGYSWGGLAALLLAMNTPVTTILSLDGSEWHYYGESAEEDRSFNLLRAAAFFRSRSTHAPYGYLSSDNKQADHPTDSIYNPHPAHYWLLPNTTHEDFSALPFLAAQIKRAGVADPPRYITLTIDWFDHYLKGLPARFPPDSPYPVIAQHSITDITARIVDSKDNTPLAYVNVGIPGKNLGTVTREDGGFNLAIDLQAANDSLSISMTGYECRILPVRKLPHTIALRRSTKTLDEIVVTSRSRKIRKLGNTTHSRFMSVGFPLRFLGAEIGVRIKLGKQAVKLRTFHCNVSDSRIDTALFRLNIYTLETGTPQNILKQNIFLPIGKRTGEYAIDLTGQNLVQKGDILVSLELIRGSSPTTGAANPGALFFSAALLNSATWRRATSQAAWKKASGIGVGFNIEVQ